MVLIWESTNKNRSHSCNKITKIWIQISRQNWKGFFSLFLFENIFCLVKLTLLSTLYFCFVQRPRKILISVAGAFRNSIIVYTPSWPPNLAFLILTRQFPRTEEETSRILNTFVSHKLLDSTSWCKDCNLFSFL